MYKKLQILGWNLKKGVKKSKNWVDVLFSHKQHIMQINAMDIY